MTSADEHGVRAEILGPSPASALRWLLLPDLDGEISHATARVEDLLRILAWWSEDDPGVGTPAELWRAAVDAASEIRSAITRARTRSLYRPDGAYEHEPLGIACVSDAAVSSFGWAVAELQRAVSGAGSVEVVEVVGVVEESAGGRESIVSTAARLQRLCELPWGEEEDLIARRLNEAPNAGGRVRLTESEEAAYGRIRDRLVTAWHDGSPLARWSY